MTFFSESRLKDLDWQVLEPVAVDNNGEFTAHHLHFSFARERRSIERPQYVLNYILNVSDSLLHMTLEPNRYLYSDNVRIERWSRNGTAADTSMPNTRGCYFTGHVKGDVNSRVALSTCDGLVRCPRLLCCYTVSLLPRGKSLIEVG